jgi:uncharacterized damage-inducible protein DinB
MTPTELKKLFGMNAYCVKVNTAELTHTDSLIQPAPMGNCLNWVLGHVVSSRKGILKLLGHEVELQNDYTRYLRGSDPIGKSEEAREFQEILADFQQTQQLIEAALADISVESLQVKLDDETVAEKLAFAYFHETYHVGQTGMLRRLAGKKGAIK